MIMVHSKNLQGKRKCNIDGGWQPSGKQKIHQEILCYQDLITWTVVLVHLRLNVADEANEGSNRLTLAFLNTSSHRRNSNPCILFNLGLVSLPAHQLLCIFLLVREGIKKKKFFWEIFPKCGWVGWLIPKQGPNPSKPPQITPKIAFFDPNFTFRSPKSHKNPWVGKQIWERSPKKNRSFWTPSLLNPKHLKQITSQIFSQNF